METYSFLRELADSWVLLALTLFFLGAIVWAFRPGSKATHDYIANIPLREDDDDKPCDGSCKDCPSKSIANLTFEEVN